MPAPAVLAATDPQIAACGPNGQQAWLCETVYRITGSKGAAELADTLASPIRIVFVLLLAFVAVRVMRRIIGGVSREARGLGRSDPLELGDRFPPPTELERRRRAQRVETLTGVLANVISLVIWTIAGVVIIGELGIELAPLLAGAGVITVVIGFGAQTAVRDFLAGLFLILEDQYGVGDVIQVDGASPPVTGTVEWISLRVTRLRDFQGVVWWIPNGQILKLGNKSQQWSRALLDIAVPPDADVTTATDVIKRTADELWNDEHWRQALLDEPEVWGIEDIGPSGVTVRLAMRTVPNEQWRVARELRRRLKQAFDEAGIGPFAEGGSPS